MAFLRPEKGMRDLVYEVLTTEPLVIVLPSDHRLAALKAISLREIVGETFVMVSRTAPTLRAITDDYINRSGINITPHHEADNLHVAISLVASTRGVALLPLYAQNLLPSSVISRPLKGTAPTIDRYWAITRQTPLRFSNFFFQEWTSWSLVCRKGLVSWETFRRSRSLKGAKVRSGRVRRLKPVDISKPFQLPNPPSTSLQGSATRPMRKFQCDAALL